MIVKFNSRGAGAGSGPVDYLLGKERNREQAKTLRGDPERVKTLIDTCDFARTYTSGVLSFEEKDLPDVDKQQLMDELEQTLLPGLDKDQYSILWVEHQDKGRLELNFVIPNIELHSGKRLQPYYDRADRPRVNAWQTLTNDRLGLSDPNDPERRRELTPGRDLPKNSQKAAESITAGLSHLAMQGLVRNRQDVINVLESAGMTIARETKSSISIASPDGGKNLRLKGALYERDFRFSESLRGELEAAGATYRDARESRISEAERCYQRG
ncbi:relaxase/mobilization nuclease domain-containing protein, partial [Salmonella enterica]